MVGVGRIKNAFSVLIVTENSYLLLGIKAMVSSYFESRGVAVNFPGRHGVHHADIVFICRKKFEPEYFCHRFSKEVGDKMWFVVSDGTALHSACERVIGSLLPRKSPMDVINLLELFLSKIESQEYYGEIQCRCCMSISLTNREWEVMHYMISKAYSIANLSILFGLSNKTISAHKQSVMRKLGFRRNIELYHWLRLGGLEKIKRS